MQWQGISQFEVAGRTVHAVLRALRQEGWHLVALVKVSGREPFQGTYEMYLDRSALRGASMLPRWRPAWHRW